MRRLSTLNKKTILAMVFSGWISIMSFAQITSDTLYLSLKQTVQIALNESPNILQSKTQKEISYWAWKTFKSDYLPQISLSGTLPNFTKNNTPVIQPDGSTDYLSVNNVNADLGLSLNQAITFTGGIISINSNLARFYRLNPS